MRRAGRWMEENRGPRRQIAIDCGHRQSGQLLRRHHRRIQFAAHASAAGCCKRGNSKSCPNYNISRHSGACRIFDRKKPCPDWSIRFVGWMDGAAQDGPDRQHIGGRTEDRDRCAVGAGSRSSVGNPLSEYPTAMLLRSLGFELCFALARPELFDDPGLLFV
jgi:hypothetical protein